METPFAPLSPSPEGRPNGPRTFSIAYGDRTWSFWAAPVNLTTLRASSAWQRSLRRSFVDKIKADFRPPAVLIYVAHRPDGTESCVGGQHCSTAALELGFEAWPLAFHARVQDESDEANLYRVLLDTHRAAPVTQTEVEIVSGMADTLAHLKVLQSAGRTWARSRGKKNWHAFTTFGATKWVQKRVGEKGLIEQLEFANRAWPDQPEVCNGDVVRGVFYLFRDWRTVHGKFRQQELGNALRGTELTKLIDMARIADFRRSFTKEGMGQALARVMAEYFNKQTPGYKLYHVSALEAAAPPDTGREGGKDA